MIAPAVLLLAAALTMPAPAHCAARADMMRALELARQEFPVARGLTAEGVLLEVFATRDGATWTALITLPSGESCIVGAGQFWEATPAISLGRPS